MKNIADLRVFLEERITELKEGIEAMKEELEIHLKALEDVDALLSREAFTSAADLVDVAGEPKFVPVSEKMAIEEEEEKEEFPINYKAGKVLGWISVAGNTMSVVPEEKIYISSEAPPFRNFFQGKIISRMEAEDEEEIKAGKLPMAEKITMDVILDDEGNIKNIIIQNYGKLDRKSEIMRTVAWTFLKIYEEQIK